MSRREAKAAFGHEIDFRIVKLRQMRVHCADDGFILVRTGDLEHSGVRFADERLFFAQAAGDDDLAVFADRFANRVEAFGFGAVEEATRVHDDKVGASVGAAELIAFGTKPRDDALAIDERFGTAEADHADGWGLLGHAVVFPRDEEAGLLQQDGRYPKAVR